MSAQQNTTKVDLNMETPFIKIVQECIVKSINIKVVYLCSHVAFKSHKKYIEKEVSNVVNKIN